MVIIELNQSFYPQSIMCELDKRSCQASFCLLNRMDANPMPRIIQDNMADIKRFAACFQLIFETLE